MLRPRLFSAAIANVTTLAIALTEPVGCVPRRSRGCLMSSRKPEDDSILPMMPEGIPQRRWEEGDPPFIVIVVDTRLDGVIDQSAGETHHISKLEAMSRLYAMEPNALTYVSHMRAVFAVWPHAHFPERKRVAYVFDLSVHEFYDFVENRIRHNFEFASSDHPNAVTYRRKYPLHHLIF